MTTKRQRKGRPPKSGDRHPCGKLRAPTEGDIMSVAIAHRARLMPKGTDTKSLRDQRAGSVFGRLALTGNITSQQYDAGIYWLDAFLGYARLMGIPIPAMLSTLASAGETRGGMDNSEMPDHIIARTRDRHRVIEGALLDHYADYHEAKAAMMHVLVMDKTPNMSSLGALRAALNIIHRRCIMPERRGNAA
jgi:hypothetical protein